MKIFFFFTIYLTLLSLSSVLSNNSLILLYLNCIKHCIDCFDIYGNLFYEGKQKRNNQVVMIILNNPLKHSTILDYLINYLNRYNDTMMQHRMILDLYVVCL